jgi:hypothetical protein
MQSLERRVHYAVPAALQECIAKHGVTKAMLGEIGRSAAWLAYRRKPAKEGMDSRYFGAMRFSILGANLTIHIPWQMPNATRCGAEVYADKPLPEEIVSYVCARVAKKWQAYVQYPELLPPRYAAANL